MTEIRARHSKNGVPDPKMVCRGGGGGAGRGVKLGRPAVGCKSTRWAVSQGCTSWVRKINSSQLDHTLAVYRNMQSDSLGTIILTYTP